MEPAAAAAATPPAAPSFMDAFNAATPGAEPAEAAVPAGEPAAPVPTPAAAAAPTAAPEWWKGLGDSYQSEADVRAALAERETLRGNQLSEDQRAVLTLTQDPEKWREFNALTHTDYAGLDDEAVLLEAFRQAHPGEDEDNLRYLFEEDQDKKYDGLNQDPESRAYKAHASARKREADQVRERLTNSRQERLDTLKKGALPASGAAPEAEDQAVERHLDLVKQTVDGFKDGYQLTIDVGGKPFNLTVEASDIPAMQAVMENPFKLDDLLKEDKKGLDPQKLSQFAALRVYGPKLLAAAIEAGQKGAGVQLPLDELHNPDGTPVAPVAGASASFAGLVNQAFGGQPTKPKY